MAPPQAMPSDRLFDCAHTLIRNQIISSALRSLNDYVALFDPADQQYSPLASPDFFVKVSLAVGTKTVTSDHPMAFTAPRLELPGDDGRSASPKAAPVTIRFDPPLADIETGVFDGTTNITRPIESIPMVQSVI
ncbi:hypothetical protein AMAG_17815 [Allomyces macrogynus ATCC 38327]|uniref:Uncharacterized protein n=1 Tax=Allomyces macrogynus (strain ATCC 38327) TaxID=578462 RepID=A0A0L0S062_ALLM3|nr:hypothetical protein AMAG_17815 [Allomyces macrogynus ATCC 38327]|eukprot:KNE55719.1 hypothetical protein AMAG_17815 [Allomyces macrogynus ATCC 38327]